MDRQITVVVVDDHAAFRDSVANILEDSGNIHVAGMGASAAEAVSLAEALAPDIVLLDIDMPGDGLVAARHIASISPNVTVAMLTGSLETRHLVAAVTAGARAYIVKGLSGRELVRIIDTVYRGQAYVSPALARSLTPELTNILQRAPRRA